MTPNWFIALPVPTAGWLDDALASAPEFMRRLRPSDIHLTIAFLGGIDEADAIKAWTAAGEINHAPIAAELTVLQPFGKRSRPSAFSAVLGAGREQVSNVIAKHREGILEAAGARPDTRPPRPHVTIARPPRGLKNRDMTAATDWAAEVRINTIVTLDRIALYTWSELRPRQLFRIAHERPLDDPAAATVVTPSDAVSEDEGPAPRRRRIR